MIENYSEDMPEEMKVSPELKMLQGRLNTVNKQIAMINDDMQWAMTLKDMLENRIALEKELLQEWLENQKKSPK